MSNNKYPFKSQDVSSTGFGVREKPESDHIPQVAKMVDVKPESDKNKYTMLPADPEGFIIFKPDFDTPCGEILAWVDDFSDNAQKILSELNQLQARVAELETIEDEFARFRDKVWHIDNWSRHMSRGQILKDIHEMLMPYAMVVDATQKEASHEL